MMINSQWQTPAVSEVVDAGPVTLPLDSTPPALGPGVLSGATAVAPADDGSPLPEPGGASDGEGTAGSNDTLSTPPRHPAATPPPVHAPVATGDFADIFEWASKATPFIEIQCRIGECDMHMTPGLHWHGSGALVTLDNRLYVITNRHVIASTDEFQIVIRFLEVDKASGSISEAIALTFGPRDFRVHPDDVDVAWVDVSSSRDAFARGGIIPMSLSDADVRVGSAIRFIGHPAAEANDFAPLRLTQGVVSRVFRDDKDGWRIGTDASINPGNSGGPCLDTHGDIWGLAVSGLDLDGGSQNFAVHVREVPAAIAGGVPFDPSTMLLSQDVVLRDVLQQDVCMASKDWPLSQPELELLDAIINEHEWTFVGCERVELAGDELASVDVGGMLAGEPPDEILLLATPYNLSDTDLVVYDGQDAIVYSNVADTSHAVLKVPWGSVGGGLDCVVHNADRGPASVLVLVFR
jgi:S1-C subfamily serine protease